MGIAPLVTLWLVPLATAASDKGSAPFQRMVAGAEVDWTSGTIMVRAGAAADIRMPNPNLARPGAERRARAAAVEGMRKALRALGLGGDFDAKAALERAALYHPEYQSNGGVVLTLTARFSDLLPAKPAAVSLRVASMPFALVPIVSAGGKTVSLGHATYRPGSACPRDAVAARRDGEGRLVLASADAKLVDSLAGAAVVIYLEKPQP